MLVDSWVSIVNVGEAAAATQTLVFRRRGPHESVQVFDSNVDFDPQQGPGTEVVDARAQWLWNQQFDPSEHRTPPDTYWFSIRATSSNLVPSIEFIETVFLEDGSQNRSVFLRYPPGDFALFHRRVRLMPGVVVPEGGLVFEPLS